MSHQQTEQGHQPVTTGANSILEAARAVMTITKDARSLIAANEEDPDISLYRVRNRTFVPYTEL